MTLICSHARRCPLCRGLTPFEGIQSLKVNFALVELLTLIGEGGGGAAAAAHQCGECGKAATGFCQQCTHYFCNSCYSDIHKSRIMSAHVKVAASEAKKEVKCADHEKALELFCLTCQVCLQLIAARWCC
jgi:hypothetical protein